MFFFRRDGRAALSHFNIRAALLIFLFNLRMNCSKTVSDRTDGYNHGSDQNGDFTCISSNGRDSLKFVAFVSAIQESSRIQRPH